MQRYLSLGSYTKETFGTKLYKLALDGGFTCPNRDGTLGTRGCIFCSGRGSGDFAESTAEGVAAAIERAKGRVAHKNRGGGYIAYFQSYTATYAPTEKLEALFTAAIQCEDVRVLSVATRPDCLGDETVALLKNLNEVKPVWVERGLQSIHEDTARYIRRGYETEVYYDAVKRLHAAGLTVITHMIIALPGETEEMIFKTAEAIGRAGSDGVKFQLLHVLRHTDLADEFHAGKFVLPDMDEYIRILAGCIERVPKDMVIHRMTGDGAKRELIAPMWSADKKRVLNAINRYFEEHDIIQGRLFKNE